MVSAHGIGGAADLPIPAEFAIAGAGAALAVSFIVLALAWRTPRFHSATAGRPLPRLQAVVDGPAFGWKCPPAPEELSSRCEQSRGPGQSDHPPLQEPTQAFEVPRLVDVEAAWEQVHRESEVHREPEPSARPTTSETRETRAERPASHGSAVHDIEDSNWVWL